MTYIHPHQEQHTYQKIIFALIAVALGFALYLIALYTQAVNLKHDIAAAKDRTKEITMESAGLQNQIFELLQEDRLKAFAAERGLVEEKNPHYFQVSSEWLFATQY